MLNATYEQSAAIAMNGEPIDAMLDVIRRNPAINGTFRRGIDLAVKRGMKKRTGWPTKCWVIEFLGNNRARFECRPAGHQFEAAMFPKAPNGKVPSDAIQRKFARYWGKDTNQPGVTMKCPKCK